MGQFVAKQILPECEMVTVPGTDIERSTWKKCGSYTYAVNGALAGLAVGVAVAFTQDLSMVMKVCIAVALTVVGGLAGYFTGGYVYANQWDGSLRTMQVKRRNNEKVGMTAKEAAIAANQSMSQQTQSQNMANAYGGGGVGMGGAVAAGAVGGMVAELMD